MASYTDVVVIRHPQPGAVAVSNPTFPSCLSLHQVLSAQKTNHKVWNGYQRHSWRMLQWNPWSSIVSSVALSFLVGHWCCWVWQRKRAAHSCFVFLRSWRQNTATYRCWTRETGWESTQHRHYSTCSPSERSWVLSTVWRYVCKGKQNILPCTVNLCDDRNKPAHHFERRKRERDRPLFVTWYKMTSLRLWPPRGSTVNSIRVGDVKTGNNSWCSKVDQVTNTFPSKRVSSALFPHACD